MRTQLRAALLGVSTEQLEKSSADIMRHLLSLPQILQAKTIFCYVGVQNEISTTAALSFALESGKLLCVPRCEKNGVMHACQIRSLAELHPAPFGLLEPDETAQIVAPAKLDAVIVPGIAFSRGGARLGQGGGFYDRYLPQCENAVLVGLARDAFVLETIPAQSYDIAVDILVTETGIYL